MMRSMLVIKVITVAAVLAACEQQASRALDKNPDYAGRADNHDPSNAMHDSVLRQRILTGQTDR